MAQPIVAPPEREEQHLKMSYEEFLAWGEDTTHAEWVDGEVTVFMPPKTLHQDIAGLLYGLMLYYTKFFDFGRILIAPFEMRLALGRSSREPDILFVARENLERITPERLEGPADLAVELISDSSVARDRADKFYEYQAAGVREYWIVDPRPGKQRVDLYHLTPDGLYQAILPDAQGRYHSTVVPGFWFAAEWLWQEPLPSPFELLLQIAPQMMNKAPDTTAK